MSDNAEIVDEAEAPAENKEEAQEQPTAQATEEEERVEHVNDDGEGLGEQLTPPVSDLPVESKSATEGTPIEPVKVVDDETKDQRDVEPLAEKPEAKEETIDDKGDTSEAKDDEFVKLDDGKGTVSSPEAKEKRRKDKKKRKGSRGQDRSADSSRAVPKLRKKSSRSDGSGGSQGQAVASRVASEQQAIDLLEDIIAGIFEAADVNQQGFLSRDDYIQLLRSERLGHFSSDDLSQYLAHFDQLPNGIMTYDEFKPVAYDLILMYYRTTDTSASEWCPLQSPKVGLFFLNKYTGHTQIHAPPGFEHLAEEASQAGREHDIAFLSQTYADLEAVNRELENERERHKITMNELAKANEELENVATQLYETGQTLDETNAELQARDAEIGQMQGIIAERDEEIARLNASVMELQIVQQQLDITKQNFIQSENTAKERDQVVTEKDSAISQLRYQFESLTDQIKTARGVIDARDSTIEQLQMEWDSEKQQTKQLKDQVTQLQREVIQLGEELQQGKSMLDEKISALSLARKQLRNTRERNSELEKMLDKMNAATNKLQAAELEIKTLKSFLTSKTAIMERRKKELKEIKEHVMELEDKDQKRTYILADVLEKTARLQQDFTVTHQQTPPIRPSSAPHDSKEVETPASKGHTIASHKQLRSVPLSQSFRSSKSKASKKSRVSRRLPPITPTKKSEFTMPTKNEIRQREKEIDIMDDTLVMGAEGVGLDTQELAMSQQVSIGDRVIIQIKKSMYELEPQKVTGIVKYVGKVDSEFVDNRMYVGVKLDEPYGNTDGVFKGKRYFKCPPNHGRFVRITNIISVLPVKSMFYRSLVDPIQPKNMFNGPAGTNSNRSSAHSVKVL